jgi:deoxyguanosine kinase
VSQQMPHRPWYLVVEGAIGVGKTTLARMLREQFQTGLLLEVFEENPFLSKFYEAREQYAFQTQMFFLLSRYRQQQQIPQFLQHGALISDYMFAKDWLFAKLNLSGDEWNVYQQLHTALAEQIPAADLVVYLQADTDTLLGRIALRDRPYERDMDREYIGTLRQAYEHYFATQQNLAVLFIDTNDLNFVTNPNDFQDIQNRIRSALQEGVFQPTLPRLEHHPADRLELRPGRPLADFQRFHNDLDRIKGFNTNLYFNYLRLGEEIGELGSELAQAWIEEETLKAQGELPLQARRQALDKYRHGLESELADCMAYLLKMANYAGIDLEAAYLDKMTINQTRVWRQSLSKNV